MRILTVTCNSAVDTTYLLAGLTPGAINRVAQVLPRPGGKGNNVARVLAALGAAPVATGFAGGRNGAFISQALDTEGVHAAFVPVCGESRICLTIVEQPSGRVTELREPGPSLTTEDGERLIAHVQELAAQVSSAVVSGSLPPGLPVDFYARLIGALKDRGLFVALDASGDALRFGLRGKPDLIKPNRDELRGLLATDLSGDLDHLIAQTRGRLIGAELDAEAVVLVSLGAAGAVLIARDRAFVARPPEIDSVNTVGAGDALLAGFTHAREGGLDGGAALARAVATGTAATLNPAVGAVDVATIESVLTRVTVEAIESAPVSIPIRPATFAATAPPVQS